MIQQDFAESFPRLLLNNMKLHVERWVKEYPDVPFNSVTLYHFSPTKFRKYAKAAIQTQYAVVFEISDEDETLSLTDEQVREASLEIITGKKPQNPWETFRSDMDDDAFLTPDFLNVYKEPPSKDFRAEWRFFVKLLNTELGPQIRTEEPHFTLWDGGHGEAFEIGGQICEVKREIERWEIKHPQTITEEKIKEEKVAELKSRLAELEAEWREDKPDADPSALTNLFALSGEFWKVCYKGKTAHFRDLDAIRYVAYLLQYPGKDFSLNELSNLVKGNCQEPDGHYSKYSAEQLEAEGLSLENSLADMLSPDEAARMEDAAEKIWGALQAAKKSNDQNCLEKAEEDWRKTVLFFDNNYSLTIRPEGGGLKFYQHHRLSKENENLRKNISKQIKNATKTIKKNMPDLSEHLNNYISKGQKVSYRPTPPIEWHVRM